MKTAIIRCDASSEIGTGHVMRCLSLAIKLAESYINVEFVCRENIGDLIEFIECRGFKVHKLTKLSCRLRHGSQYLQWLGCSQIEDAEDTIKILKKLSRVDLLIIDHYALDTQWENIVQTYASKLMAVDDLANREHSVDILLDQNFYQNADRYVGLIPNKCKVMLGPQYALLRDEFRLKNRNSQYNIPKLKKILVFMGGADPTDETSKVIDALTQFNDIVVDIVVGASNLNRKKIENKCFSIKKFNFHFQVDYFAKLMLEADLFIGAGGSTTWERCHLGLPSLVVTIAENQEQTTNELNQAGIIDMLGKAPDVTSESIIERIRFYKKNVSRLHELSELSSKLVDGHGVDRVIECINKVLQNVT